MTTFPPPLAAVKSKDASATCATAEGIYPHAGSSHERIRWMPLLKRQHHS